jgi:hypothetical protein
MDNERRKNKRIGLESRLIMKRIDSEETPREVAIEIVDVSKTGIGFNCTVPLEIGAVYEAFLTLWTKEVIHAFVEIVRLIQDDDVYKYGAIFIGMSETDASRIEIYDTVHTNVEQ